MSLEDLIHKKRKTKEEKAFLDTYYRFMPVVDSKSVMNLLCKYIESIDFDIKKKIKTDSDNNIYQIYKHGGIVNNNETYVLVLEEYKKYNKTIRDMGSMGVYKSAINDKYDEDVGVSINGQYEMFKKSMDSICSNVYELVNYLVEIFYVEYPGSNKDLLWNTYGKYIFNNVKRNTNKPILFPAPDESGDIEYLNTKYTLQVVEIWLNIDIKKMNMQKPF